MRDKIVLYHKLSDCSFDFKLKEHITIILNCGDMVTKLFYELLENFVCDYNANTSIHSVDFSNIVLFNAKFNLPIIPNLETLKGNVIVIDNFDYLRRKHPGLVDYINMDISNQYLIIGRQVEGLFVDLHCVSEIQRNGDTFTLSFM